MSSDAEITTLYCKFNNKAGYILIVYSSLISFALILFAGAYLSFQENQVRQLERGISSIKAFYIAQAGLKKCSYPNNGIEYDTDCPFGGGIYTVTHSNEQYTSVGEVRGVKRTLKADIVGQQDSESNLGDYYRDKYIEGAVYVHHDFGTINLKGVIDGTGSSYALQTADVVLSDPFNRNITFKPNREHVIQRKPRPDYTSIWNQLSDEYKLNKINFIDNNDNSNIVEHSISNAKQYLDLGGATYYFNIVFGEIRNPRLTVKKNKTYTLPEGNYFLQDFMLEEYAQLKVSGPVTIFLYSRQNTNDFQMRKYSSINKDGNPGDFTLLGFNKYTRNTPLPKVEMYRISQLYGTILAPYYQFVIREGAKLEGALIVHNFMMLNQDYLPPPPWEINYADLSQSGGTSFTNIKNWKEVESK